MSLGADLIGGTGRYDQPFDYRLEPDEEITAPIELSLQDFCAMLYRAKKVRLLGSIQHKQETVDEEADPPEITYSTVTTEIDVELQRTTEDLMAYAQNERELLKSETFLVFYDDDGNSFALVSRPYLIDGDFVNAAGVYVLSVDDQPENVEPKQVGFGIPYSGDFYSFTADLEILGTTYGFDCKSFLFGIPADDPDLYVISAELTVSVTEWFPYATKNGSAAWNTSTGAPANGGPGA